MNWSDIPRNPSPRVLKQFAALSVLFFGGLAAWDTALAGDRHLFRGAVFGGIAAVIGPLGFIRPQALRPIYVGWMIVAFPPGWLISRLALAAIFYVIFTPLALVFRLIGRRSLLEKGAGSLFQSNNGSKRLPTPFSEEQGSYWAARNGARDAQSYFRQF